MFVSSLFRVSIFLSPLTTIMDFFDESSRTPTPKEKIVNVVLCRNGVKNFNPANLPTYMKLSPLSLQPPATPPPKPFENVANTRKKNFCTLCRKNGEPVQVYTSHNIKADDGKVTCPVLKNYTCCLCGATGEIAHTKTHCPRFLDVENVVQPKPKFRIMSNGKSTTAVLHK